MFSQIDISLTVRQVEAKYANSGRGRPRYPVRSMLLALLFMRFEAIPSTRKLCRRLEKRQYAREICEFNGNTPRHNTFSLFISRARPDPIEGLFAAREEGRNKRQGRESREDRTPKLRAGLGAHTVTSMSALPLSYIVRAANVNDKDVAQPLLKQASRLIKHCGKRISHVIADRQYYSADIFTAIRKLGAEPVIPRTHNAKDGLIDLWVTKRFRVRGDPRLVKLYKLRMTVERSFKAGKLELMMENLRWRGVAKVRMHVALCFTCMYAVAITAHRNGRPELANSIGAFTY